MSAPDRPTRVRPRVTHTCPCGCGRRLPRTRLLCPDTWEQVPAHLRQAAHEADAAWMDAMDNVIAWVRAHPDVRAPRRRDGANRQAPVRTDNGRGAP